MKRTKQETVHLWAAIAATILAAVALLCLPARAVQAISPRPTQPAPVEKPAQEQKGGTIELQARFPANWPWGEADWQDLWTVVQWQDEKGAWQDVKGWQGTLDGVETNGDVAGTKTWWVGTSDLGKGPFRWRVYRSQGGGVLATSGPFDLPGATGAVVTVEVSLTP